MAKAMSAYYLAIDIGTAVGNLLAQMITDGALADLKAARGCVIRSDLR